MIQLDGIIEAISPIHIGNGKSKGAFIPTFEYIPGRTIRGMVGYYLYKNDIDLFMNSGINEDEDISKMGIFFKNAYPFENYDQIVASPLWFKWCKKCGSLLERNDAECKKIINGRQCLHEGKKNSGLMSFESIKNKVLTVKDYNKRQIITKCPIRRDVHASMGGKERGYELTPYHIESISAGAKFRFRILVKDEFGDKIVEAFKAAGLFYGIGGFRSRGYGSVSLDSLKKNDVKSIIERRRDELSKINSKLLVTNSQMILRSGDDETLVGFESLKENIDKMLDFLKIKGKIEIDLNQAKISTSIAAGWSYKRNNSISELIPCIGPGSCIKVSGDPEALAALEIYGIGNMINCGYGDVYIIGDVV